MSLWNRIEKVLEQGLETSREVIGKARSGAQDLGEIGVLKFDVLQLERQSAKAMSKLGHEVFQAFGERGQDTISKDADGIGPLMAELLDIERSIDEKEQAIVEVRRKDDGPPHGDKSE